MYAHFQEYDDNYVRVSSNESVDAYLASEKFFRDWGGDRALPDVVSIRSFIYRIYPTFFLQGICYNKKYYVMNRDFVEVQKSLVNHTPSAFTRMRVSMFIRCLATNNKWVLTDEEIASIVLTCAADFSEGYMDFFPYTVRMFTGSELKRAAYSSVYELPPIQFSVYEFEEPQAEVDAVVRSKLSEITPLVEEGEVALVDDTGLALYSMGGNPGSNIKQFFEKMPPREFNKMIRYMNDDRGHIQIALGAAYKLDGQLFTILVEANFPIIWRSYLDVQSKTFDPYIHYANPDGFYLAEGETPTAIMLQWLWYRFKRRIISSWG